MNRFLTCLYAALLFVVSAAQAQQPPKSPITDRILKAYGVNDVEGVGRELAAYHKAFPGNPYAKFFQAWYDQWSYKDMNIPLRAYSELIQSNPEITESFLYRSMLFNAKGMTDRAITDMDAAIKTEGEQVTADWLSVRADYHFTNKNYEAAYRDFEAAIRKMPSNARYYTGLSNTGGHIGKNVQVQQVFQSALAGSEKENPALRASYGDHLFRQQDYSSAAEQFRQAFALSGFRPGPDDYNGAGTAAYKLKDYALAKKYYEQAIAAFPKDITLLINRASLAIDESAWEQVYSYAQKALALDANDPMANMLMAVGVKKTGRGDALSAEYEKKAQELNQRTGAYR